MLQVCNVESLKNKKNAWSLKTGKISNCIDLLHHCSNHAVNMFTFLQIENLTKQNKIIVMSNLRVCILERASALLDIPDCCMHNCSISSWRSSRSAFYKCEIINLEKLMVIFQSTNKMEKSTRFQGLVKFQQIVNVPSGFSKERTRQSWKREIRPFTEE